MAQKKNIMTSGGYMANRTMEEPKPIFSITSDELPEIKGWKVGKRYNIGMMVEMVSASKGDGYSLEGVDDKKYRGRFRILEARECDDDENYDEKK